MAGYLIMHSGWVAVAVIVGCALVMVKGALRRP